MNNKEMLASLIYVSLFVSCYGVEDIEVSCNINVKKPIQCVSEKFLSFSVDPAVVLAGVNLSEHSLKLAKYLSPAYIKIAGPTTQFIKYVENDNGARSLLADNGNSVQITPAIWFGINEWLKLAKLTPIFGINDRDMVNGVWNPKDTLPLFEISQQLNISCYWQLGYDTSYKNETRYKQDLHILNFILSTYSPANDTWKLIGSDISVFPTDRTENILMDLNDITKAVMWNPSITGEQFPPKDLAFKILQRQSSKPRTKLWATIPKSPGPVTFESAILWAKQIGNAAKMGYDVIFRQPRIYELFTDTPIFWLSLLHKQLMGCNVLEIKSSIFQEDSNIFAHCSKNQNNYVRRGAVTVMVVNDRPTKYNIKVKLGNTLSEKSMEVQSYILTSSNPNSTKVYLNDQILSPEIFKRKELFEAKIRRTKSISHILLSLPPLSVGFFVLPGARCPLCIEKEKETKLLLDEIEEDQNIPLSEELALRLGQRGTFAKHNLLEEITHNLKEEMESDGKYYRYSSKQTVPILYQNQEEQQTLDEQIDEKDRKHFIDRVKLTDKHKKIFDFEKQRDNIKKFILEKTKTVKPSDKPQTLHITSQEIQNLLKDRAVEKAAEKNVVFTDDELDALVRKASKGFLKLRRRRSLSMSSSEKEKRDINMHLVEKYSQMDPNEHYHHSRHHNQPIQKKSIGRKKKKVRGTRAVNVDLGDVKAKLAERKRYWEDKRDELLGNSLNVKENIKDKIRQIKSSLRYKRDINMDLLDQNSEPSNKKTKFKIKKNEIEATLRNSGETSADMDEFGDTYIEDPGTKRKADVFVEIADPEDLDEEELIIDTVKNKKLNKLFDKKANTDPFAVEHPEIEIVEPKRKKSKSKSRNHSNDKLQFLTTSEEFTDIEEDLPCIHEYFGSEHIKDGKGQGKKGRLPDINDFYALGKRKKREIDPELAKSFGNLKRDADITIVQITKLYKDSSLPFDLLQELLLDLPVLEKPLLTELVDFDGYLMPDKFAEIQKNDTKDDSNFGQVLLFNDNIWNEDSRKTDSISDASYHSNITKFKKTQELDVASINDKNTDLNAKVNDVNSNENFLLSPLTLQDTDEVDSILEVPFMENMVNPDDQVLGNKNELENTNENLQKFRKRRSLYDNSSSQKNKHKKVTTERKDDRTAKGSQKSLNDQMHTIREKLQKQKDDIDKLLQKPKGQAGKEQRKNKLNEKKRSHLKHGKDDIKFEIEFPKFSSRLKESQIDVVKEQIPRVVKRSMSTDKKAFGDYHPITPDIKPWKPSEISTLNLKRQAYFSNPKKIIPADDQHIFENIFNKHHNLRKRFIDTDVEITGNEIDEDINTIKKETEDIRTRFKYDKYSNEIANKKLDTEDQEFFKFKLPNNVELEIVNNERDSEPVEKNFNKVAKMEGLKEFTNTLSSEDNLKDAKSEENNIVSNRNEKTTNIKDGKIDKDQSFHLKEFEVTKEDIETIENEVNPEIKHTHDIKDIFGDNNFKFKLEDNDEMDFLKSDKDIEIKLLHHNEISPKFLNNDKNIDNLKDDPSLNEGNIIPEITSRYMKPIESVEKIINNIKYFFTDVGKEFQQYLKHIGIN